jgi:hypothetical protein
MCFFAGSMLNRLQSAVQAECAHIPGQKVTIGALYYIPPNIVAVKNIRSVDQNSQLLFTVPTAYVRLALKESFIKKRIVLAEIVVDGPSIYDPQFYSYLNKYGRNLIDYILSLPQQNIRLRVRGARLNESGSITAGCQFLTDMVFVFDGLSWSVVGRLYEERLTVCAQAADKKGCVSRRVPLEYRIKGLLSNSKFIIENCELLRENFYVKIWGSFGGNHLFVKGFSFINTAFKERNYVKEKKSRIRDIVEIVTGKIWQQQLPALKMSDVDLYILDIDSALVLALPSITIDRLSMSVDNIPVSAKGTVKIEKPYTFAFSVSSSLKNNADKRLEHLNRIALDINGDTDGLRGRCDGTLEVGLGKAGDAAYPYEMTKIAFDHLSVDWKEFPLVRVNAQKCDIVCATSSNTYEIPLRLMKAAAFLHGKKDLRVGLQSNVHDGTLSAKAQIDISDFPLKVTALLRARDITASRLSGLLVHFSKVDGKLFSQMAYRNFPQRILKGGMSIANGRLNDFEFFKWLSDFMAVPGLRSFSFNQASVNFAVDETSARMQSISLRAPDMTIGGFFILGKKDMVTSRLSLQFSRKLLEESEKFRQITKMLPGGDGPIVFDFQLSGILHAMNFQWLDSPLKAQVQDAIPGFVERHIEQSVESLMEGNAHARP